MPTIEIRLSAEQTIAARTHNLSLRPSFVSDCPSLFAIFTFAKPHKANKSNFTSMAPTKLHCCLMHDTRTCDTHKFSRLRVALLAKNHQPDYAPTQPYLRNYTTFAPQVRTTHTNESHGVVRPALLLSGATRHLPGMLRQYRRLPPGSSRVAHAPGVHPL
jgi:hypothetical protein